MLIKYINHRYVILMESDKYEQRYHKTNCSACQQWSKSRTNVIKQTGTKWRKSKVKRFKIWSRIGGKSDKECKKV